MTDEAHDWSYGREGFPLYCTHCAFMNEALPIRWIGHPVYPSDPPEDFDRDPCTWYWYKDPADIPDRHFERYGLERAPMATEPPAAEAVARGPRPRRWGRTRARSARARPGRRLAADLARRGGERALGAAARPAGRRVVRRRSRSRWR